MVAQSRFFKFVEANARAKATKNRSRILTRWNSKQQDAWEREYRAQQLLSPSNVPQADVLRFVRWMKKEHRKRGERLELEGKRVLDLGSGTGRNAYYFAKEGAR
jgi:2-polyprenyl-3-methyl-5-hydroxy-6-metoxy-1,4-benzoquinol methylase